jgi:4-hydroxy-2-oxoheptanedioate aldolase
MKNSIKTLWADNRPVLNGWLAVSNGFTAEIMAAQGYDSLTIDLQHGLVDYQGAVSMLQAMRSSGVAPMIRVPWLDPTHIMKALDAGAYGIICPMINTRKEAEELVSYVRYPPTGVRSFGPVRANLTVGPDYFAGADQEIICLAMIETEQALSNLDDILATPGLDGIYIGPADLTISLFGRRFPTGFDRTEPEMIDVIRYILAAAKKAGKRAGLHNGHADYAAKAVEWGFDLLTISSDARLLAEAAKTSVNAFRRALAKP